VLQLRWTEASKRVSVRGVLGVVMFRWSWRLDALSNKLLHVFVQALQLPAERIPDFFVLRL